MPVRPVLTAACATALLAAGATAGAPAASAAAGCTLTAPAQVRIGKPYQAYTLSATGSCTTSPGWAYWSLIHPSQGAVDFAVVDGRSSWAWDVYDTLPTGVQTFRPEVALARDGSTQTQNTVTTDIRLAGAAALTVTRTGSTVTVTGYARRYEPSADATVVYPGGTTYLHYRWPGTATWKLLRYGASDSQGRLSLTFTASRPLEYRFLTAATPGVWNATSPVVTG